MMSTKTVGDNAERGAVTIELALLFPLLAVLVFGIINYSIGFRSSLTVNTAVREAARVDASDSVRPTADYDALASLQASLSTDQLNTLTKVIIYKATAADGSVPPNCLTITPTTSKSGVSGVCNVYASAVVKNLATYASNFSNTVACGSALDGSWCPSSRNNSLTTYSTATPDSVGVWVQTRYHDFTHTIFPSITITRTAVLRLVPVIS